MWTFGWFRNVDHREDPEHLYRGGRGSSRRRTTVIGALADSVEEVIDLEPDQIQPAPKIGTQIRTDFIKGMGRRETRFIMILDIDKAFSADELGALQSVDKQLEEVPV